MYFKMCQYVESFVRHGDMPTWQAAVYLLALTTDWPLDLRLKIVALQLVVCI